MSVAVLKQQIKQALDNGSNATQDLDNQVDTDAIRQQTADKIAEAVQVYLKTALTTVIAGGVPIPQDGGAGLKATMTAQINSV